MALPLNEGQEVSAVSFKVWVVELEVQRVLERLAKVVLNIEDEEDYEEVKG